MRPQFANYKNSNKVWRTLILTYELRSATREFLENPAPTMLDVRISRSVITLPYRRIHYGQDE
jgi:acetolactate synthase I/II/III large subunit